MSEQPVFKPIPFWTGCHAQTIAASFLSFGSNPSSLKRFVYLSDGDKLVMEITTPKGWREEDKTVVLVHGLCGSHRSTYIVRMASKLYKDGVRTIRINLRGCGSGRGHAKKMYHSESSEDVWEAIKEIKRDTPRSPITIIGYSLGGNIILKMGGERGDEAKGLIDKIISVNPPIHVESTIEHLSKNTFYERYFMTALRDDVAFLHENFDDLPPIRIPTEMTLLEFNEFYVAPQSGYDDVHEYYNACSSCWLVHNIAVPCHILFARDDPIVDCNLLNHSGLPDNVEVLITENGGHLGYLGVPGKKGGFHWMDSVLLQWVFEDWE
ncbi:MAG: alpha/beta fold hydrolase [Simkaniaceae bacterium]|jgi:predicted alpha/beta-fold hydrolase|nr:MAG: alpha/beta fold hydrolase [Simkaniaceae bacterium]